MSKYNDEDWPDAPYTVSEAPMISVRIKLDRMNDHLQYIKILLFFIMGLISAFLSAWIAR